MKYLKEFNVFDHIPEWLPKPENINDIEVGYRIKNIEMIEDPDPVPKGTEGTIVHIDKYLNIIEVKWDNNRTLSVLFDVDDFEWQPR